MKRRGQLETAVAHPSKRVRRDILGPLNAPCSFSKALTAHTPRKEKLRKKLHQKRNNISRLQAKVNMLQFQLDNFNKKNSTAELVKDATKLLPGLAGHFFATHLNLETVYLSCA